MVKAFQLNTGDSIPSIGFGTGTAIYNKDASTLVQLAIEAGITHLDGAQMYSNEDSLGQGIKLSKKPRSELFVTTKVLNLAPGETIKQSLQKSLANLGLEYVDLFLIHDPSRASSKGNLAEWWAGMEEVYREGLAKAIGVSNFRVEDLQVVLESASIVPAVNQIELHPYVWKAAEPLVKFCQSKGIIIASYAGLTPIIRATGGPVDPVLAVIKSRLDKAHGNPVSAGQILTRWLLQKGMVVVTTSSKVERIREFLDAENLPSLTTNEIEAIDAAGKMLHKRIFGGHIFNDS